MAFIVAFERWRARAANADAQRVECEVLEHLGGELRRALSTALASAVQRDDARQTLRVCRLFAPLGLAEDALLDYYHHVQTRVVAHAEALLARLVAQQEQQQEQQSTAAHAAPPAAPPAVDADGFVFQTLDDDGTVRDAAPDERLSCSDALTDLFEVRFAGARGTAGRDSRNAVWRSLWPASSRTSACCTTSMLCLALAPSAL